MMGESIKISFLGDIMCELSTFRNMKKNAGEGYDFSSFFEDMRNKLANSDFVIGNLETPLAGEDAGYTKELYSFNTPDDFAGALKSAGIDCVTTANNHCLDRGIDGLKRTLDILDQVGVMHTGTYRNQTESKNPFITDIKGQRIAIISCTAGTNYSVNHVKLNQNELCLVDQLHPQDMTFYSSNSQLKRNGLKKVISRVLSEETRMGIKKMFGRPVNRPRTDSEFDEQQMILYLEKIREKIEAAMNKDANYIIVCPHTGGQFNVEPGERTNYIVDFLCDSGVDAVVASHPHVVQKFENRNEIPIAYCLGNYSMSPKSVYLLHENKPEYSVMLNLYLREGKLEKSTFSILKIIEDKQLRVLPVEDIASKITNEKELDELKQDVKFIYKRFSGRDIEHMNILPEYKL